MKCELFDSLDVNIVMPKVIRGLAKTTRASRVDWISFTGMKLLEQVERHGEHVFQWPAPKDQERARFLNEVRSQILPSVSSIKTLKWVQEGRVVVPAYYQKELVGLFVMSGKWRRDSLKRLNQAVEKELKHAKKYLAFAYQYLDAVSRSYEDDLTGLYNQRFLPRVLEHEIEAHRRRNQNFCLLFMDIDFFKSVNDRRGHWVGSKLLTQLGGLLETLIRTCDYGFRYGGDEFVILLGGASAANAIKVAERIREAIEGHEFNVEGHRLNLTVSIGLAEYPTHASSAPELIQIADRAMYDGKRRSRNVVLIAG